MPSKSKAQQKLMAACAHGADYPSCPPAKVARDFNKADQASGLKAERALPAHMGMLQEHGLVKKSG